MADDPNVESTEAFATFLMEMSSRVEDRPAPGSFVVAPNDWKAHALELFQARPNRILTAHNFTNTASLAAYLKRYGTPRALVVADADAKKIEAVLDYHDAPVDQTEAVPNWCEHKAAFSATYHPAYAKWREIHGKPVGQVALGEFLEDRMMDVIRPDAASLYELVMNFEATKGQTFKQTHRLDNGDTQILFDEVVNGRGALTCPKEIALRLPVFRGLDPQDIRVRFRFRVGDGKLSFVLLIADVEMMEREAFDRCVDAFAVDYSATQIVRR